MFGRCISLWMINVCQGRWIMKSSSSWQEVWGKLSQSHFLGPGEPEVAWAPDVWPHLYGKRSPKVMLDNWALKWAWCLERTRAHTDTHTSKLILLKRWKKGLVALFLKLYYCCYNYSVFFLYICERDFMGITIFFFQCGFQILFNEKEYNQYEWGLRLPGFKSRILTSCVTSGKFLNLLCLSFSICTTGITILMPIW